MKSNQSNSKSIADHLAELSKDELITLLVNFSEEIREVEQALALKFMDVGGKKSLSQYKKIIRASIKQHADRHGFVTYRKVPYAVTGAEKVMEKANEVAKKGEHLQAAEIIFTILHEMGDLLQLCDDSDGIVGGLIHECLSSIHDISVELENSASKERPVLFKMLLEEALHPNLQGWSEWKLSLLNSAIYVMKATSEKDLWSAQLDNMENQEKNESFYSSYFFEGAAELRYKVIQKFEGEDNAAEFLQSHLDMKDFREKAIASAIHDRDYNKALELAEQGERKDAAEGLPGLVHKWKEYRYEIYGLTHQVEQQIQLAEEFALSGEYEYYLLLQELYGKDAWQAAYKEFLNKLEAMGISNWRSAELYRQVLVEEGETSRLMEYVRKNKWSVLQYYPHLVGDYAEEVFLLFTQIITEEAANSTNRKEYQKVCKKIRSLIKAGGAVPAGEVIEQLRNDYPYRPALLDELGKIKID
ncbi:hypothetical protein ACM1RC_15330 [Paenibacillus azoreducens]|uniref:hypothetical protein n=1 Tax=Paenibacillus azoreducens TaxID=116718 RepID=UPI0039F55A9F